MPSDPLTECNVSRVAPIWHDLLDEEPEMVNALLVYVVANAVFNLPVIMLAACGCFFGQQLRSKIQVGGWQPGRDQEMMMMVQQPLMVQAPEGVPVQQAASSSAQTQPLVLRPPEVSPPPQYPNHE
jgi:hypothetical protein